MRREALLGDVAGTSKTWDVLVIGGGATGLGTAVDAASRGLSVVLLERFDFASETSSRSTKLVHGGVRYLKQGRIGLVREALRERGILQRNAPGLVRPLPFVIPTRSFWQKAFYGAGLKLYEELAGSLGLGPTEILSSAATLEALPSLQPEGLRGGVQYWDAQFDDALLAVSLARTVTSLGGFPINYCEVTGLLLEKGRVTGARARDLETGRDFEVHARTVVNATGVWSDTLRRQADPDSAPSLRISQGAHIVVGQNFLPGPAALMIPQTSDGRVLFAIPWMGRCLIGTTDTAVKDACSHPTPQPSEINFLLQESARHLTQPIGRSDVLSVFAGLRPLASTDPSRRTSSLSREHQILRSQTGLISVTGGKWTTYRSMAEEIVNSVLQVGGWKDRACRTKDLPIDLATAKQDNVLLADDEPLHPSLTITAREIRDAATLNMARTLEDVLARRSRCLLLNAAAAMAIAPRAAKILGEVLGKEPDWVQKQAQAFSVLAKNYGV